MAVLVSIFIAPPRIKITALSPQYFGTESCNRAIIATINILVTFFIGFLGTLIKAPQIAIRFLKLMHSYR